VTGLVNLAREHPTQLSGGQQQRVALARSLAASPRLVLFDEPLSNVDAKVRDELRVELKRMQSALGFAGLYVTHDQDEAMQIGSRLVVLKDGHVEQVGRPEDVYRSPETRYVGEFVGAGTVLPGVVSESGPDGATVVTDAGPLRVKTSVARGSHVVAVVRPHQVTLSAHPLADEAVASLAGRVVARLFMGTVIEYFVEVGTARMRVWAPEDVDLQEGGNAWVTIRQAQLIPQPDGGQ
jgi:iron(III) transport system ATP-binding protein